MTNRDHSKQFEALKEGPETKKVQTGPSNLGVLPEEIRESSQRTLKHFYKEHKSFLKVGSVLGVVAGVTCFPEVVHATLVQTLDNMNTLTTGRLKTYGISAASIVAAILAIWNKNPKLAGAVVGIGIALSFYLSWVEGGMTMGAINPIREE